MGIIEGLINAGKDIFNISQLQEQKNYDRQLQQTIFQREDNAIQRRVADIKDAGLSPILAAGNPAQAGAVVKSQAPQFTPSSGDIAGEALALMKMKADIHQSEAQAKLTEAQTAKTETESAFNSQTMTDRIASVASGLKGQDLSNVRATIDNQIARLGITKAQLDNVKATIGNQAATAGLNEQQLDITSKQLAIEWSTKVGLPPGHTGGPMVEVPAVLGQQFGLIGEGIKGFVKGAIDTVTGKNKSKK